MHTFTVVAAVLLQLIAATSLQARDEFQPGPSAFVCLYMTNGINWTGEGQNLCEESGDCALQLPDGLTSNVSSAGAAEGATCFLYSEQNCTGTRSAPVLNLGYADLGGIGFAKKAQSFRCWKWCGYGITPSASSSRSTAASILSTLGTAPATANAQVIDNSAAISTTLSTSTSTNAAISTTLSASTPTDVSTSTTLSASTPSDASISITLSGSTPTANNAQVVNEEASITTTLGGAPASTITTPSISSSSSKASATAATSSTIPLVIVSSFPWTGTGSMPTSTSMFTSVITLTHTYADRSSTTLITTSIVEPVPPGATNMPR